MPYLSVRARKSSMSLSNRSKNGCGIFVIWRKHLFIGLVPAIIKKDKFRLDAILVGPRQKILDVLEQQIGKWVRDICNLAKASLYRAGSSNHQKRQIPS